MSVARAERPDAAASLREEAMALAGQLAEASRRLRAALEEKDRLSRLLDLVLESIDIGVVLHDDEGRVLAANGAAQQMGAVEIGPSRRALADCFDPRADVIDERPFRPRGVAGPTWVARRAFVPLPGGGAGRLLTVQDVTRALKVEEQAGRRTRLEALGRMAAEIAHEVRNPLGSLELFSSLLVDELADRPEAREMADQLLLGVRRLSGTVTHLLSAVRGRPVERRECDAAALAREAAAALAPVAAARGVDLAAPPERASVPALLDEEGIRQALLNLVGNALDVTPEGGAVRIAAALVGDDVRIEVADSGPGVPPEMRERIFEPFFTTRRQGTGLGLAVVERVALSHGGAVRILDAPEGGALFRIEMPARPNGADGEELLD